jgi:protein-tyrosine-phosphatase
VFYLAFGYFVAYLPYVILAKALSSGIVPGVDAPVGGLVLLPAAALGQLLVMPVFLGASGWWRFAGEQRSRGRRSLLPRRDTVIAALFMAVVIATTTLNFSFAGASILFMLLLMRAGVLILSPIVDVACRRKVHSYSLVALVFSLLAAAVSLGDVKSYRLPTVGVLSLCAYLASYVGRLHVMSRVARTGGREVDRTYFVEEHAMAAVWLVVLCAVGAALGQPDLRAGFTAFLGSRGALYAAGIGVLYEVLFNFGALIDLDVRGHAWCVPVIRGVTLVSGMAATYILATAGLAPPGSLQLIAVVFIVGAVVAQSYPALRASLRGAAPVPERMVLLVCGGSQSRSAMTQCIARAVLASTRPGHRVRIASVGGKLHTPGAPMTDAAYGVLQEVGVIPHCHRPRPLTAELCRQADVIYCMAAEHRAAVLALAPDVAGRTHCVADTDLPEPFTMSLDDPRRAAAVIQHDVPRRMADQFPEHFP